MEISIEMVPAGEIGCPQPGDLLFAHRRGLASRVIRVGETVKFGKSNWSHCAYVETPLAVIEALTHGVARTSIEVYRNIEIALVHTNLSQEDEAQATAFARSCLGQHYGFSTILGIGLRFLTPGKGLWFGMNGTEICSGLAAQTQVRGWANYPWNPASCAPSELWNAYAKPLA